MDINIAIDRLSQRQKQLEKNDFDGIFASLDNGTRSDVYEFLVNELGIDPIPYMTKIYKGMFFGTKRGKLILPENIEAIEPLSFSGAEIDSVKLPEGIKTIPTKAFYNCTIKRIFVPESCKSFGQNAFDSMNNSDFIIVTPWRESKFDKLSIPKSEVDFYKGCLRFQHKPKDEPVLDGTNQGDKE